LYNIIDVEYNFLTFVLGSIPSIISIITDVKYKNESEKLAYLQTLFEMRSEIMKRFKSRGKKGKNINITDLCKSIYGDNERHWLYIEEENIFCSYCICFANEIDHKDVTDIDIISSTKLSHCGDTTRLKRKLDRHEQNAFHQKICKYVEKELTTTNSIAINNSTKANPLRNAVSCIIKVIIHLATHGM
jgi:hypothetical protein